MAAIELQRGRVIDLGRWYAGGQHQLARPPSSLWAGPYPGSHVLSKKEGERIFVEWDCTNSGDGTGNARLLIKKDGVNLAVGPGHSMSPGASRTIVASWLVQGLVPGNYVLTAEMIDASVPGSTPVVPTIDGGPASHNCVVTVTSSSLPPVMPPPPPPTSGPVWVSGAPTIV